MFRFAVRDYYSRPCAVVEQDFFELIDENGFYARGSAFNDFNVISLTFRKGNQDFVVLVNNDPIDINGGITGPNDTLGEDIYEELVDFGDLIFNPDKDKGNPLAIILASIFVLIVVIFISKIFEKRKNKNEKTKRSDKK